MSPFNLAPAETDGHWEMASDYSRRIQAAAFIGDDVLKQIKEAAGRWHVALS